MIGLGGERLNRREEDYRLFSISSVASFKTPPIVAAPETVPSLWMIMMRMTFPSTLTPRACGACPSTPVVGTYQYTIL